MNEADVHIAGNAYGLYPRESFTARGIYFSFYNSLTMLFAETNGRFYGGGVLELSPNELRRLTLVYGEISDEKFEYFIELHKFPKVGPETVLDSYDIWLSKILELANVDLAAVRNDSAAVRNHRLRHSNRT